MPKAACSVFKPSVVDFATQHTHVHQLILQKHKGIVMIGFSLLDLVVNSMLLTACSTTLLVMRATDKTHAFGAHVALVKKILVELMEVEMFSFTTRSGRLGFNTDRFEH